MHAKKDKLKAKKYYGLSLGEAYKTLDYLKDKNRTDLIAQTENIIDAGFN